jgi:hypothetical protein
MSVLIAGSLVHFWRLSSHPRRLLCTWSLLDSACRGSESNCVGVALSETVSVRDTRNPTGGTLALNPQGWSALLGS